MTLERPACVWVQLWAGEATHACSVADVFADDVLTVTPIGGGVPTEYPAGVWREAITYDGQGHPFAHYRASTDAPLPLPFTTKELS